jgi:DNA-binding Lrp family transcriptional regulator
MPLSYRQMYMAEVGFALYEVYERGVPIAEIAEMLDLPPEWVAERIEAARLCTLL